MISAVCGPILLKFGMGTSFGPVRLWLNAFYSMTNFLLNKLFKLMYSIYAVSSGQSVGRSQPSRSRIESTQLVAARSDAGGLRAPVRVEPR